MSPNKYIKDVARTLPVGKCYITPGWRDSGMGMLTVTRRRPSGNIVAGVYLLDMLCLGVKDTFFRHNLDTEEFEELLYAIYHHKEPEEISYNDAHNLIYGAIEFAEEAGVEPHPDFDLTEYILSEDTDDIPLREFEYGREGKHVLVIGPGGDERRYVNSIAERLGDSFEFIAPEEMEEEIYGEDFPEEEEYAYQYPDYPTVLQVKHQFIADELLSHRNKDTLSDETIARILSLPPDEAAADLGTVLLYSIATTYATINNGTIGEYKNTPILHAVILLGAIESGAGLPALLELLRMNDDFMEYHLGDLAGEFLPQTLECAARNDIDALGEYLEEKGLNIWFRIQAVEALARIAFHNPDKRDAIIGYFRHMLSAMTEGYNNGSATFDPSFAGLLVSSLLDIHAEELLPEIRALFDTYNVDIEVAGDYIDVEKEMLHPRHEFNPKTLTPRERYDIVAGCC